MSKFDVDFLAGYIMDYCQNCGHNSAHNYASPSLNPPAYNECYNIYCRCNQFYPIFNNIVELVGSIPTTAQILETIRSRPCTIPV